MVECDQQDDPKVPTVRTPYNGAQTTAAPSPGGVLWVVAGVALLVNGLSLASSPLWVCPDTTYYVALAGEIADQGEFSSELALMRPLGYPLMLALIFRIFGSLSPIAIQVVQHGAVIGTALLLTLTAWHLTRHRGAALASGLLCALSLQLVAYGNLIITEAPFAFLVAATVYFLVRYHLCGKGTLLALASAVAGASYLFRPIGMSAVAICALAALHVAWRRQIAIGCQAADKTFARDAVRVDKSGFPGPWRRTVFGLALAIAPAFAVTLPGMINNKLTHGGDLSSRCANLALYFRVFYMDDLDAPRSEALSDIRAVVEEAKGRGYLAPEADHRAWGQVWKAYESVRGIPLADSSAIMGQAARDAVEDNLGATLMQTVRYSLWMLLSPDSFYRFHPGGAPGVRSVGGGYGRDPNAEIYDVATYQPTVRRWTDPYAHYLQLGSEPTRVTPLWSDVNRWAYRYVEKGPPIVGLGDSLYETFIWLCLLCVGGSLFTRHRTTWLLVAGVVAVHVVVSAFLGGPTARYAVPVRPLLFLFPSLMVLLPGWLAEFVRCRRVGGQPGTAGRPAAAKSWIDDGAVEGQPS